MVTGGGHRRSCQALLSRHWLPRRYLLPLVYRRRHAGSIGVSSSMAKYGAALSAPHRSRPIKGQIQHQQDRAGHRETVAWLVMCKLEAHMKKEQRSSSNFFLKFSIYLQFRNKCKSAGKPIKVITAILFVIIFATDICTDQTQKLTPPLICPLWVQ